MKEIVDKNGKFLCTINEDIDVDLSEPAFKDCKIVEGNNALKEYQAQIDEENRIKNLQVIAEQDEEHKHLDELEDRIAKLEGLLNK